MTRRMMRRATMVLMLGMLMAVAMSGIAVGHSGDQSYVYLDIFDTSIEGRIHYPVADLSEVLDVDIPDDDDDAAIAWAEANADIVNGYSAEHIAMSATDGSQWEIVFTDEFDALFGGEYLTTAFVVEGFVEVPREFVVTYDAIMHAKPERDALLAIATDFGSGTFNNEADALVRFTASSTTQTIDLGESSFWSGVGGVIVLGVDHIRIGMDHILFIFALVLPYSYSVGPSGGNHRRASVRACGGC